MREMALERFNAAATCERVGGRQRNAFRWIAERTCQQRFGRIVFQRRDGKNQIAAFRFGESFEIFADRRNPRRRRRWQCVDGSAPSP